MFLQCPDFQEDICLCPDLQNQAITIQHNIQVIDLLLVTAVQGIGDSQQSGQLGHDQAIYNRQFAKSCFFPL